MTIMLPRLSGRGLSAHCDPAHLSLAQLCRSYEALPRVEIYEAQGAGIAKSFKE